MEFMYWQEFVRSSRARKRYWARSYAGWRRFTAAKPGPTHIALAALEKVSRINFMVTQNVDRLHHRAGSSPLEIHGTVYSVICLQCGFSFSRNVFQDQVKTLNPKWASAVESLDCGNPGSDKSFGMQQRPDGDIEIDEKYWEEDFHIPNCQKCDGVLKPDVRISFYRPSFCALCNCDHMLISQPRDILGICKPPIKSSNQPTLGTGVHCTQCHQQWNPNF
eukprot:TRINITY_DN5628_c0_g1_i4.p1 TRINITY_DN5628_c0_g1~~TRINITY_DN5628_c0_g1_i4.p1  ORF type:complete len:220 (-),score=34.90 TRINITY_DN5628_c0_g1_i4:1385-2044(-)